MGLNLTALILNRTGDKRLIQSGVLIVSDLTNRPILLGQSALSGILKKDYERYGEYYIQTSLGEKKAVFWYANKLNSFMESAPGYYAFGEYVLSRYPLSFEPRLDAPIFITQELTITDDSRYSVEKILLEKV